MLSEDDMKYFAEVASLQKTVKFLKDNAEVRNHRAFPAAALHCGCGICNRKRGIEPRQCVYLSGQCAFYQEVCP